jgi:hypothetical protein
MKLFFWEEPPDFLSGKILQEMKEVVKVDDAKPAPGNKGYREEHHTDGDRKRKAQGNDIHLRGEFGDEAKADLSKKKNSQGRRGQFYRQNEERARKKDHSLEKIRTYSERAHGNCLETMDQQGDEDKMAVNGQKNYESHQLRKSGEYRVVCLSIRGGSLGKAKAHHEADEIAGELKGAHNEKHGKRKEHPENQLTDNYGRQCGGLEGKRLGIASDNWEKHNGKGNHDQGLK